MKTEQIKEITSKAIEQLSEAPFVIFVSQLSNNFGASAFRSKQTISLLTFSPRHSFYGRGSAGLSAEFRELSNQERVRHRSIGATYCVDIRRPAAGPTAVGLLSRTLYSC